MNRLRFRQYHLDSHTSGDIPNIGKAFDAKQWQASLREAHADSITCFATCHHGWSYYDTKIGPKHPGLSFDLLRAQFDASKEIDVNVPIYMTMGIHNWAARQHPEWREIGHDGQYLGWTPSVTRPGFIAMCLNTPYLQWVCDQIHEVVRLFPNCDGIFLDIIKQGPCCCRWCLESMQELGMDATCEQDRLAHADLVLTRYYKIATAACRVDDPNMPVFHNSGHVKKGDQRIIDHVSHFELESLPTGGWGYDHFPISAKYCNKLGMEYLGMTGKFHTTWGEIGGYKHPNALHYECSAMLAMGAKCSVGDQMLPSGKLDPSTVRLIGQAYAEVEKKEPWCDDVTGVADIAMISNEKAGKVLKVGQLDSFDTDADMGAARILLESHFLFDVLEEKMSFEGYKALLLPDQIVVTDELKSRIDAYLAGGGKLILTGDSGIDESGQTCKWDLGAELCGKSEFLPDYIAPVEGIAPSFTASPMVMYLRSNRLRVSQGESLGKVYDPYFNRTFQHFSSHQHTVYREEPTEFDCGVIHGNILYLAHPVFTIYRAFGSVIYRHYITNAIRRFLGDDISLTTNMPSMARLNLLEQKNKQRYVLHLLYANRMLRGGSMKLPDGIAKPMQAVEVIEELLPLCNTQVSLKLDKPIRNITLEPEGKELPFSQNNGRIDIELDSFTCHQMVVLHY